MDDNVKLMDKKVDDLTVGDAVKINLGIIAIMAAVPVTIGCVSAVKNHVTTWNHDRKIKKTLKPIEV